ncbi:MAG: glycosyltransferase family 4 protein [Proteobacteria bacterium]|nr:glycosyltransferase family 4 protein [Pseudomonadota bacterium]
MNLDPVSVLPPADPARLSRLHLAVWLEYASTLAVYDRVGMLDRELAIYRRLVPHLRAITLITWSRGEDEAYRAALGPIGLVHNANDWTWPAWMAILLATFGLRFPGPRLIKTNQMSGARHILRVARAWRTPLVARCGYPWSVFAEREKGPDDPVTREARATERAVFRGATHVVGSTEEIAGLAIARDGVPAERVSVVPNYVDTDLLSPGEGHRRGGRSVVGFLGRLEAQKNPLALVEAVSGLDADLVVIGEGSLRGEMEALARARGVSVRFLGNVRHGELPALFRSFDVFVLPSLFEGHPKALMEAMSCGVPVIGTDTPGIREVIRADESGLLCRTDAAALHEAIARLLGDEALAARLGAGARSQIVATVSLDRTVERELRVLSHAARPQ